VLPVAPPLAAPAGWRFRGFGSPFLLLAAVLLIVGAVLGSWLALAGGWVLAYTSRTLSPAEAKWAVFGLPGVAVLGCVVWLWGRENGRWGEPIPQGAMADALSGVWPVVVRTAAVASAVYLLWRAARRR
jgi:SNF family Na+-dependent transporter